MAKAVYTLAQAVARIAGTAEYAPGSTITYAATAPGSSAYGAVSALNGTQKSFLNMAMSAWDDVANIHFSSQPEGSNANIKVYNVYNTSFAGAELNGSIMLSSAYSYMLNPSLGNYGYMAMMHEIGHALGLNHPGDYNGGSPTYAANAKYMQDSQQYTIMSYFNASNTGGNYGGYYASTPLLHDIAAIQKLYGADYTTRSGDTVYGFHSTADREAFDFTVNTHPVVCIWDGGGNDTLDVSGFASNQLIDLHAGSFSDVGGMTKNVSIAYGCSIENAMGGNGNDTLTGNELNNVLYGGAGNDTLNGDKGEDTLIGGAGDDTYYVNSAGDVVVENSSEGTDTVYSSVTYALSMNVENLVLTGRDGLGAIGNDLDNTLTGNSGNNVLNGGAGNDTMVGGTGNDTYVVDSSNDVVRELTAQGTDTVYASASFTLSDNVENLIFTSNANLNGTGNALANVITGNTGSNSLSGGAGNDTIYGGAGNDILNGGAGNDALFGGDGADTFVFDTTSRVGKDTLKDFNPSQGDVIDIHTLLNGFTVGSLESYVKLSASGNSSLMMLDLDGADKAFGFVQYAMFEKFSGATATARYLFDHGNLIA